MADQDIEVQEQIQVEEPTQVDNSSNLENQELVNTPEVDLNQSVSNLTDAKKVLAAQEKAKSLKKTATQEAPASKTPSVNPVKQYEEIQKLVGKQSAELGQLRKFYKENQPVIDAYKQYLEQQKESDLAEKYKEDPVGVLRELARKEALEHIKPYQDTILDAQAKSVNESIKAASGEDYKTYAPIMEQMLEGFLEMDEANGTTYATDMVKNPQILVQLAAGRFALEEKGKVVEQRTVAQQQKEENLRLANSIGKGNRVTSSSTAEDFKNLNLEQKTQRLKQLGIV